MTRRPRSRSQATPTARTRRIRAAQDRGNDDVTTRQPNEAATIGTSDRRRLPWRPILIVTLILALVGAIGGGVLVWQRVARFNDSVSTASATSFDLWGPLGGQERVNIALFGYGGPEHKGGNYLADSIQILSIDPQADTTTLIPVPRDFWVEGLPELPNNGKINEAFAVGELRGGLDEAGAMTTEVLAAVTGLKIDYWLAMDFSGFTDMIDAVGGVTVKNPRAFSYTWSESAYRKGRFNAGTFAKGEIALNGEEALAYARARYTSLVEESSDFARSVRQQRVLKALRDKVIGGGGIGAIGPGLGLMDALAGRMRTNLSAIDLWLLSGHLQVDRRLEMKEGEVLQATSNTDGEYILVPIGQTSPTDYQPIRDWLSSELAKPIATPSPSPSGSP